MTHQLWFCLIGTVSMAQSAIVSLSPSVELSVTSNGSTVAATASYVSDVFALERINHLWTIIAPVSNKKEE